MQQAAFLRLLCAAFLVLIVSTLSLGAQQGAPLSAPNSALPAPDSASSPEGQFPKRNSERWSTHWTRYKSESDPEINFWIFDLKIKWD